MTVTLEPFFFYALAIFFFIVLLVFFSLVFYALGRLFAAQRQQQQMANFSFLTAFYATVEARSLQNATVISKIVERQVPSPQMDPKTQQEIEKIYNEINDDFDMFSEGVALEKTRRRQTREQDEPAQQDLPFKIEETFDPEDKNSPEAYRELV